MGTGWQNLNVTGFSQAKFWFKAKYNLFSVSQASQKVKCWCIKHCKRGVTQYFIQFQVKTWKNELSPFCKFCNSVQIKILLAGLNIWNSLPENLNINCFFPYLQALFDPEVAAHRLPVLWAGDVQEAVKDPLGNTVVKHLQGRKFN